MIGSNKSSYYIWEKKDMIIWLAIVYHSVMKNNKALTIDYILQNKLYRILHHSVASQWCLYTLILNLSIGKSLALIATKKSHCLQKELSS